MIFNRKPNHEYVGKLSHEKDRDREEDSDLYYNTNTKSFFIVDSVEDDNGVNAWCDHSIRQIGEVSESSEIEQMVNKFLNS